MSKKHMPRPDGERIVTLEVKMIDFEKKLDSVSIKLDTLISMSQTQTTFDERIRRIEEVLKADSTRRWMFYTLSAVAGSILTYLIVFFLQNK